jgi:cytochrome c biogenesis protein CcmG/thiol:disulfide interchange protein DsbE
VPTLRPSFVPFTFLPITFVGAMALAVAPTIVLGCAAAKAEMPPPASSPLMRKPLPSFRRPTVQGPTFDTDAHRGGIVVVKFFAKYCVPCQRTLPAAEALHRDWSDVTLVGVSEDENPSGAQTQVDRYRLTFPVVHDAGNVLAGRFRVTEMPVTFVTNRQGQIVWVGGPDQPEKDLARAVEAARR